MIRSFLLILAVVLGSFIGVITKVSYGNKGLKRKTKKSSKSLGKNRK